MCYLIYTTPTLFYPIWILVIAGRLHGFGVLLHDLSHLNLKDKSIKMRILEVLTGYIIASSANAMAYHHIRHHRHTLMANDPYFDLNKKCSGFERIVLTFKKGLFFVPFWMARSYLSPFALLFPRLRNFYGRIFLQDVSGEDLTNSAEIKTCLLEDIPIACFHLALLFLTIFKYSFLFYYYYVAIFPAGVFCIYRLLIEHEYDLVPNKNVYTMIESTYDHHMSFFDRILIGPRNIGFHCMHHIHPNVGLHALPRLQKWYLENSEQYKQKYSKLQ